MPRKRRDVPWLDQRDGIFYAFRYNVALKRVDRESLHTRDPVDAARKFGEYLLDLPRRTFVPGLTVSQALDHYYKEHCEAVDDRGRSLVANAVRQENAIRHLKAWFRDAQVKDIGPLESRAYVVARRTGVIGGGKRRKDKTGSDNTVRRELNVLVAAANHALKWGRLTAGDMPRVELPAEQRGGGVKWLTKAQLSAALERAAADDPLLHAFILIAYYTAGRKKSVQELTKFQVDLVNLRINLMVDGAKATKKRKPVVPIYPEILPTVKWLMRTSETTWLFGKRVDFYRPFVELMAELKIEAHPHMLRHSRATHMLQDGESIFKVAKLLGDTVKTVEDVYGHSDPEFLATSSGV